MPDRVTRFGVSLSARLVKEFDETISDLGYVSRSKAIADAITEFINQKNLDEHGMLIATVSYIYDHHISEVNKRLVELQHGFEKNINSMMHNHITHNHCVEVLIVHGTSHELEKLYGSLSAIRGVQNCKLATLKKTNTNPINQ